MLSWNERNMDIPVAANVLGTLGAVRLSIVPYHSKFTDKVIGLLVNTSLSPSICR